MVEETARAIHRVGRPDQPSGTGQPGEGHDSACSHRPRPGPAPGRPPPVQHRPEDGQEGADHDLLGPGVGAVVEPVRAGAGVGQGHRHDGRGHGAEGGHHPEAAPAPAAQGEKGHRRPDQVELLLDRQRPGVQQRRRRPEVHEVALVREDEAPVGHVAQGGEGVAPQRGERVGLGEVGGVDHDEPHEHEEGGQQAPGSPLVERPKRDSARALPLLHQQRRDQEA